MTRPTPTSSAHLRVGIAGAGLMGRWHADAAARSGAAVVAVLDPQLGLAGRLADAHGARGYADLDRLLAESEIDVLHVCTPLATHGDLASRALDAGLHVLVEKPLVPDADATVALLDHARTAGRIVCPVHQFPFQRGVQTVLARRAELGTVLGFDAVFHSAGAVGRDDHATDAVVADLLPHPISLMQTLLPGAPPAEGWQTVHPHAGELTATAVQGAATVRVRISMGARPTVARLALYGTAGAAHLDLFHGYAVVEPGAVSRARKVAAPFARAGREVAAATGNLGRRAVRWEPAYPGLRELVGRFYHAVRGEARPPVSDAQTVEVARLRDRLIRDAGLLP